jgi:hypothetical protein
MAPDPPVSNAVETLAQLAGEVLGCKSLLGDRLAELRAQDWRYKSGR